MPTKTISQSHKIKNHLKFVHAAPSGQRNSLTLVTRQFCSDKPTNFPPHAADTPVSKHFNTTDGDDQHDSSAEMEDNLYYFLARRTDLYQSFNKK